MFQRTVFITPSSTVFGCIGVYTPYSRHWQRFDKTFVLQDSAARPDGQTVKHRNSSNFVV
ncbi:protein of unknown function [Thiomonas sp. CB3]|nr:protein of unknown function [Thiomonas sp. CB3]